MGIRATDLAGRIKTFNEELGEFVKECTDEKWRKESPKERWAVGVVARHIAASHYGALGLVKLLVGGERLPDLTSGGIDAMNSMHAEKHRDCTREEVLALLRKNGTSVVDFVAGLDDADLDRVGHVAAAGGDLTAEQLITGLFLQSGREHLSNLVSATGA